jgi:hypothetical protein
MVTTSTATHQHGSQAHFLLDPANREYIEGRSQRPHGQFIAPINNFTKVTVVLGIGAFLSLLAAIIAAVIGLSTVTRTASQSGWLATEATIRDKRAYTAGENDEYTLIVVFQTADSEYPLRIEADINVPRSTYNSLSIGDTLTINYNPQNPTQAATPPAPFSPIALLAPLALTLGLGAATLIASRPARRRFAEAARQNEMYYASARVVDGTLLAATGKSQDLGTTDEGVPSFLYEVDLHYAFVSPAGTTLERRSKHSRAETEARAIPAPGTTIKVLYADDTHFFIL